MKNSTIESNYNINFREEDCLTLSDHILHKHSVELIGMKRIGISNFLRFFLNNEDVYKKYFGQNHQLFITVDLNDLIEREIFPFWRLTFKRVVDAVESSNLEDSSKRKISQNFLTSIQSGDLFLTIDGIRDSLIEITKNGIHPTIFFIRFDRLIDAASKDFFSNLQGLIEATGLNLSYIFTANRKLSDLSPSVFDINTMNAMSQTQYLKPSNKKDTAIMLDYLLTKYDLKLDQKEIDLLINLSGGHVQYLNYSIIIASELGRITTDKLVSEIKNDERILLQSEEIFSSLSESEQNALLAFIKNKDIKVLDSFSYITESSIIQNGKVFSPLLEEFLVDMIKEKENQNKSTLTKKEHLLFETLKSKINEICSREEIVKNVWPEYSEYGVSDWSIDRLVARLRKKVEIQKSDYLIETIRTRGFKLVKS